VPAPVCLIVNPSAGGGKAGLLAPDVERTLRGQGLEVRRVDTRDLDHARELAEQGARAGETVVVLSGDGLIGVVADVLRDFPGAVLGVLPGGRGNDLARVLGIPKDPIAACAVIARGVPRAMDLGEVGGQAFVGIASAGFDSVANRIANEAPAWLGNLVYAYGALRALASWRLRASRSSSILPASASASRPTRSELATRRLTEAGCERRRTRCSTTACWRWSCSRPSASASS
jgi:diacylglycerol kinase family enzyme